MELALAELEGSDGEGVEEATLGALLSGAGVDGAVAMGAAGVAEGSTLAGMLGLATAAVAFSVFDAAGARAGCDAGAAF